MRPDRTRYFVIFGAMRTGSNLLEETLGAIPDVRIFGEAFNPAFPGHPGQTEIAGWTMKERDDDPLGCLERMIASAGRGIAGFRMFEGHAPAVQARALVDPRCAAIILTRDPIESYVSLKLAQQTDQWLLRSESGRLKGRIRFDAGEFDTYLAGLRRYYDGLAAQLEAGGREAFELRYADLLDRRILTRVAEFIGLDGSKLPPAAPLIRQNPEPLWQKVANYGELVEAAAAMGLATRPPAPDPSQRFGAAVAKGHWGHVACLTGGAGDLAALTMLAVMSGQAAPRNQGQFLDLCQKLEEGDGFDRVLAPASISALLANGTGLAVAVHPAARAHFAFATHALDRWRGDRAIRETLARRCGSVPRRRDLGRILATRPGRERYRRLFAAYLEIAEAALAGEGPHQIEQDWYAQSATMDAWRERFRLDCELKLEDADDAARNIAETGLPDAVVSRAAAALRQCAALVTRHLQRALTPELEDRIRSIWAEDYERLGYRPIAAQKV